MDVQVVGTYAYAATSLGLAIVDVSNVAAPRWVANCDLPFMAESVSVVGNLAYVADGTAGLKIVNIANPTSPYLVGSCGTPFYACDVTVAGDLAYVADISAGLEIIRVANPAAPQLVGSYDTPGSVYGLTGGRQFRLHGQQRCGLADHQRDGSCRHPVLPASMTRRVVRWTLPVVGDLAYVADFGSLQIVNISNPAAPSWVGVCELHGGSQRGAERDRGG